MMTVERPVAELSEFPGHWPVEVAVSVPPSYAEDWRDVTADPCEVSHGLNSVVVIR